MYKILDALIRMLAPVLAHTAEEAWSGLKFKSQDAESVHLASMPKVDDSIDWQGEQSKWEKIMALRGKVLQVLEGLRQQKDITSNQQAAVDINCGDDELFAAVSGFGIPQFAALCIVSEVNLHKTSGETTVTAQKSRHNKCLRCWNYWPSVGSSGTSEDLCSRCAEIVGKSR